MSLKDLVEGDCGGTNSLVRLTSHFVQDKSRKDEHFNHAFQQNDSAASSNNTNQMVQQFMEERLEQCPQSFRMDSLLTEVQNIGDGKESAVYYPSLLYSNNMCMTTGTGAIYMQPSHEENRIFNSINHNNNIISGEAANSWAKQYALESNKNYEHSPSSDENACIWKNPPIGSPEEVHELGWGPKWAQEYYVESTSNNNLFNESQTLPSNDLSQSEEYLIDENSKEVDDIRIAANQLVDSVNDVDSKMLYSKFMKFMKQVGDGAVIGKSEEVEDQSDGEGGGWLGASGISNWSEEFLKEDSSSWTSEFNNDIAIGGGGDGRDDVDAFSSQLWDKLHKRWEETLTDSNDGDNSASWINKFADHSSSLQDYKFSEDNPMLSNNDALKEGIKKREEGDLPSAVLCFEAALQKEPNNSNAWEFLGVTQAETEQDRLAIIALKKCLDLDPKNLTALMTLAASYTNENYQNQACHVLKEWIYANPKYTDIVPETPVSMKQSSLHNISSIMPLSFHEEVQNLYITAARRNPTDSIDPDVQCGLGILFSLTAENEKAADCFRAALRVQPTDSRLWNRLGASLANGNKSEEAVDAYHHALQLSPGFIRARYNLGITCVHLRAYREACEHLITALNQQASGRGLQGERSMIMSDSIWTTFRLAVALLNRNDLLPFINNRDLNSLNHEFGLND